MPCQGSIVARNRVASLSRPTWTSLDPSLGASPGPPRSSRSSGTSPRVPEVRRNEGHAQVVGGEDPDAAVAVEIEDSIACITGRSPTDVAGPAARPSGRRSGRKTRSLAPGPGRRPAASAFGPKIGATTRSGRLSPSTSAPAEPVDARRTVGDRPNLPGVVEVIAALADRQQELALASARSSRIRRRWRSRPCRRRRGRPWRC